MQKFLGNIILVIGFLAFVYLTSYKGDLISPKLLWILLSLFLIAFGLFLAKFHKLKTNLSIPGQKAEDSVTKPNKPWKVLKLNPNNCEVKSRSFYSEVPGDSFPTQTEMLDGLYDPGRNYRTEKQIQTYIVFHARISGIEYKFISHPTSLDKDFVLRELDNERVNLLFDPNDPTKYKFETTWL